MTRPIYIALEGIEGCGKTTHAALLAKHLGAQLTRENGGTQIGQQIRSLTHGISNPDVNHPMHPWTEALLFAADRAQHIAEVVDPVLYRGQHLVSDRSYISSLAYQGFGRELDMDQLMSVNMIAVHDRVPDIVLHLQIDYETMVKRKKSGKLDRIEQEDEAFFKRVIHGFEVMKQWAPCDRWVVIDGAQSEGEVTRLINEAVADYMETWT